MPFVWQPAFLPLALFVGARRKQLSVLHHNSPPMHLQRRRERTLVSSAMSDTCMVRCCPTKANCTRCARALEARNGTSPVTSDLTPASAAQTGDSSPDEKSLYLKRDSWGIQAHDPCFPAAVAALSDSTNCSPIKADPGRMNRALAVLAPCVPIAISAICATAGGARR